MTLAAQSGVPGPAQLSGAPERRHSRDEMLALFRAARAEIQAAVPQGYDLVDTFITQRRLEAERE